MKRSAIAAIAACAATGALMVGCSSASGPSHKDDSAFTYLLDRQGKWTENKPTTLPPLPAAGAALYGFDVSNDTPLKFAIDPGSLTVGTDGVVRYAVIVTSPTGARNVNYEGIRCDTYEWRLYASLNADHDGWDQTVENNWTDIETGTLNAYRATLYKDYFCENKMPVGDTRVILDNLRYARTVGGRGR